MGVITLYDVLEVSSSASPEEIKSAYRRLAQEIHPDKLPHATAFWKKQAEEKFKEVQEAYSVLSNQNKRQQYDAQLISISQQRARQSNRAAKQAPPPAPQQQAPPSAPQNQPGAIPQSPPRNHLGLSQWPLWVWVAFYGIAWGCFIAARFAPETVLQSADGGFLLVSFGVCGAFVLIFLPLAFLARGPRKRGVNVYGGVGAFVLFWLLAFWPSTSPAVQSSAEKHMQYSPANPFVQTASPGETPADVATAQSQARGEKAASFLRMMKDTAKNHGLNTYHATRRNSYTEKISDFEYDGCRVTVTKDTTQTGPFLGTDLHHPEYYRYLETFDLSDIDRSSINRFHAPDVLSGSWKFKAFALRGFEVEFETLGGKNLVHCSAVNMNPGPKFGKDAGCLPADDSSEHLRFDSKKEAAGFSAELGEAVATCQGLGK